jgi:predicted GNAT family N-acyltransferase
MAQPPEWTIERLTRRHDRSRFSCGDPALDSYLKKYARQNERLNVSRHYVAVEPDSTLVLGYYTLSAGSVAWNILPEASSKKLPKYPVPVAHLGRLAVDQSVRGRGQGEVLLLNAFARDMPVSDQIGIQAVELVAATERAKQFYARYGFLPLADNERHLYVSLATLRKLMHWYEKTDEDYRTPFIRGMTSSSVARKRILEDDEIRAFYNSCRHRGSRICEQRSGHGIVGLGGAHERLDRQGHDEGGVVDFAVG